MRSSPILTLAFLTLFARPLFADGDAELYRACIEAEYFKKRDKIITECKAQAQQGTEEASAMLADCEESANQTSAGAAAEVRCREEAGFDSGGTSGPSIAGTIPLPRNRPKTNTTASSTHQKTTTSTPKKSNTPTKTAKPATTSNNTSPQNLDAARSESNADLSTLESQKSQANRCCNNPLACSNQMSSSDQASLRQLMNNQNGPGAGGLAEYCNQMKQLSSNSGNLNAGLASVCTSNQSACTSTAASLNAKYSSLLSNCGNCESRTLYQSTLSMVQQIQAECSQLQARATNLVNQGLGGANSDGYSQYCQQVSAANPNAMTPPNSNPNSALNNANDPMGCLANPTSPACNDCSKNPNTPACKAIAQAQQRNGEAQFEADEKKNDDFNIGSLETDPGSGLPMNNTQPAQAAKINTIANNSGGAIPGAGTSGAAPQSAQASARPSPGSPGYSTDILQGMHPGGYSAPVTGNDSGDSDSGRYGARALAGDKDQNGLLGVDLRQFLPGGSRDPKRLIGGIGRGSGIHAKEEDIWRVISIKIDEKCRLGVLWRCR